MALTYTDYINQIANLLVIPSTDANFQVMVPGMITYAEGRCYRDLNMTALYENYIAITSSGSRSISISSIGQFYNIDTLSILTPASTNPANTTGFTQCTQVSFAALNAMFQETSTFLDVPSFWAFRTDSALVFGPTPDRAYLVVFNAYVQPSALSSNNQSTPLTNYYPDLFVAASMIFASGYQRDFSAQGDNSAQGASWEQQYQILLPSARELEAMRRGQSGGWSNQKNYPETTPPRV